MKGLAGMNRSLAQVAERTAAAGRRARRPLR